MDRNSDNTTSKTVLVISSHVVRGTVGNRAVAFTLEALGHPTWILPTITLPWHPGHGPATRITASNDEFSAICNDLANAPWRNEVAGIITGFIANEQQVETIAKLVSALKETNPELIYLCDPVIGDFSSQSPPKYGEQGRLYVAEDTAAAIRQTLLPLANITTPNMFELGWLDGENSPQNQSQLLAQAKDLTQKYTLDNVLVTSVPALMRGNIGSVLLDGKNAMMSEHKSLANPPNGLGDLTSALFLSHSLNGATAQKALEKTTSSVFEVLARTAKASTAQDSINELALESNIISLSRPMAMVQMRAIR